MLKDSKQDVLWTKDYIILIFSSCGISFTTQLFLPTLPIYAQKMSNTTAFAGFMTGAYTLAAMTIRPLSGMAIDRMGRKNFLILGALICSVICFFYSFAGTVAFLIFLRILNGIGFGIHSTTAGAVAADIIPGSRLMEGMGYFSLAGSVSFALAPGIALSIIGDGHPEKFNALFLLGAAISMLSMILNLFITYERKRKNKAFIRKAVKENVMGIINNTENKNFSNMQLPKTFLGFEYSVFLPAFVVFFVYLGQGGLMSFLALYAHENKIGNVGLFFTIFATGMFFSRLLFGRICDKRGPDIVLIPAITTLALFYVLIPFIHSLNILLFLSLPFGLSMGSVYPLLNGLIIRRSSAGRRGSASAAYFCAVDTGIGIGSIFFGFIITALGYTWLYVLSSVFTLIGLGVYILWIAKKPENRVV